MENVRKGIKIAKLSTFVQENFVVSEVLCDDSLLPRVVTEKIKVW